MKPITPGKTIGVLGGGQLGRMLAMEAKRNGYNVIILDPQPTCPAGFLADKQIIAPYDDINAVNRLAEESDVVTYEFENIDLGIVEELENNNYKIFPGSQVLKISQHRLLEKTFFKENGIPVCDFAHVNSLDDLDQAMEKIGFPALLKTCRFGYDGKGQFLINNRQDALSAYEKAQAQELIWEKLVSFEKEISVICSRNLNGEVVTYPISENIHKENILDVTVVPAKISQTTLTEAKEIAEKIAEKLNIIGTFCVEMFVTENGKVIANEIAPRPHNSGHYSLDACEVSQFENQLRAICNLPLGSTKLLSPIVMVNILGSENGNTLLGVAELFKDPDVKLHLYQKHQSKPKRKMGHFTVLAETTEEALIKATTAQKKIFWGNE